MTSWNRFRDGLGFGQPTVQLVRFIDEIERSSSVNPDEAFAALQELGARLAAVEVGSFKQALDCVQQKLRTQAAGTAASGTPEALQEFFRRVNQGTASAEEVAICSRMFLIHSFVAQWLATHPELTEPSEGLKQEIDTVRLSLSAIFVRFSQAARNCAPGIVSEVSLRDLEKVLTDYQAVIDNTRADNPAVMEASYAAGQTASLLSTGYLNISRADVALPYLDRAADYFETARDPAAAAECRQRLVDTVQRLSADNDAAAEPYLKKILAVAQDEPTLAIVEARVRLADLAYRLNDFVEAIEHANAATTILGVLGYDDPLTAGVDQAFESWTSAASQEKSPVNLEQRLIQIGTSFLSILKVRQARTLELHQDAQEIEATLNRLVALLLEIPRQAEQEAAAAQEALAKYLAIEDASTGVFAKSSRAFDDALAQAQALDEALLEIRQKSDSREPEDAPDDLLAAIDQLQTVAASLKANIFRVKVQLARAYVLLGARRATELLTAARHARSILLAGRESSLKVFSEAIERTCYLESLERETMAEVMLGNFQNLWAVCEETVRDFETERYQIHSPYRQSSILRSVGTFYKLGAFAAYKLHHWDNLIEITELFKARSAVRSRLQPENPAIPETDLLEEFRKTGDELLAQQNTDEDATVELAARRRSLWDMICISRGSGTENAVEVPHLSVAALQETLAEDEAVVSFYWINAQALLIFCLDRGRFVPTLINLTAKQRKLLDEFSNFVQTFQGAQMSMSISVNKLGSYLFPAGCREFIADKKRLILSPHRDLHLFPFHALPWEQDYIATRFAVSYTPNLSSLLLPWKDRSSKSALALAVGNFANPDVPALANVEQDAVAVKQTYVAVGCEADAIVGSEVTRERIEQLRKDGALSQYHCLHLGTHGLSVFKTADNPLESQLLLHDSSLDGLDIGSLRIGAEVAVLCACNSGQRALAGRGSGDLPGDDIFGLQSALFQSGVRSVLGALWHVETVSSSALILGFHRWFAQGMEADEALQHAIRAYLKDPPAQQREIYYWAPYFLSFLGRETTANRSVEC